MRFSIRPLMKKMHSFDSEAYDELDLDSISMTIHSNLQNFSSLLSTEPSFFLLKCDSLHFKLLAKEKCVRDELN